MYPKPHVLDPTLHSQEVLEIKQKLLERTIGQPQAVDRFARILETFKAGYNDPKRPVSVVLELGPTETGKTTLVENQVLPSCRTKTPRAHAAGSRSRSDLLCPAADTSSLAACH